MARRYPGFCRKAYAEMDNKENLSPPYEANRPIPLEETWITDIDGQSVRTPVRVMLRLLPQPKLVVEYDDFPEFMRHMKKETFRISFENGGKVDMYALRYRTAPKIQGAFSPVQEPCTILDQGKSLQSVQFSIFNFPDFFGKHDQYIKTDRTKQRCGNARLEATPWLINITATANLSDNLNTLRAEGGYALTHTGVIERLDGGTFSVADVEKLLSGLRLFLAFARGSFCGLTHIEGKGLSGEQCWVQWGSYTTTPWRYVNSWAESLTRGDILSEAFPGFWRLLEQQAGVMNKPINLALYWYLCSNEGNVLEPGIILTHAALERLAYEVVGRRKTDSTGEWISKALKKVGIDPTIPESCQTLRRQVNVSDGAELLTKIRTDLVHPEMKMNVSMEAYTETRNMGQRYVELLLLKLFDYSGSYRNRLTRQWEVVPWARDESAYLQQKKGQ